MPDPLLDALDLVSTEQGTEKVSNDAPDITPDADPLLAALDLVAGDAGTTTGRATSEPTATSRAATAAEIEDQRALEELAGEIESDQAREQIVGELEQGGRAVMRAPAVAGNAVVGGLADLGADLRAIERQYLAPGYRKALELLDGLPGIDPANADAAVERSRSQQELAENLSAERQLGNVVSEADETWIDRGVDAAGRSLPAMAATAPVARFIPGGPVAKEVGQAMIQESAGVPRQIEQEIAAGKDPADAYRDALAGVLIEGAGTYVGGKVGGGIAEKVIGRKSLGVGDVYGLPPDQVGIVTRMTVLDVAKRLGRSAAAGAISEAPEESIVEIGHLAYEAMVSNPGLTFDQAVERVITASTAGALLGGLFAGGAEAAQRLQERQAERNTDPNAQTQAGLEPVTGSDPAAQPLAPTPEQKVRLANEGYTPEQIAAMDRRQAETALRPTTNPVPRSDLQGTEDDVVALANLVRGADAAAGDDSAEQVVRPPEIDQSLPQTDVAATRVEAANLFDSEAQGAPIAGFFDDLEAQAQRGELVPKEAPKPVDEGGDTVPTQQIPRVGAPAQNVPTTTVESAEKSAPDAVPEVKPSVEARASSVPTKAGNMATGQRVRYAKGKRNGLEATVRQVLPDGRVVLETDDGKTFGANGGITPDNLEKIDAPAPQAAAPAAPVAESVPAAPAAADPVVEPAAEATPAVKAKQKAEPSWVDQVRRLAKKLSKERGYTGNMQDLLNEADAILRAQSQSPAVEKILDAPPADFDEYVRGDSGQVTDEMVDERLRDAIEKGNVTKVKEPERKQHAPAIIAEAKTGRPATIHGYRGEGKPKSEIYSYADNPAFGNGRYIAGTKEQAREYGDSITEESISAENPLVIRTDKEWKELTKAAGWKFPNPYGLDRAEVNTYGEKIRAEVLRRGHDALVIDPSEDGDMAKTLWNVAGHQQVVSYATPAAEKTAPTEPAAPAPKEQSREETQEGQGQAEALLDETAKPVPSQGPAKPKKSKKQQAEDLLDAEPQTASTENEPKQDSAKETTNEPATPAGDNQGRTGTDDAGADDARGSGAGSGAGGGTDDRRGSDATADRGADGRESGVDGSAAGDGARTGGTETDAGPAADVGSSEPSEPSAREEKPQVERPKAARPTGFRFESVADAMPPKGDMARARANLAAIETSQRVMAEGRAPTAEERDVIARFSGWGSLKWVFNVETAAKDPKKWEVYQEAARILKGEARADAEAATNDTADESAEAEVPADETRRAAIVSTLNAHYTHPQIVDDVWRMVLRMIGPKIPSQLRTLDPSVGMGAFIGLEPSEVRGRTAWTAVELDPTTAAMAGQVYSDVRVVNAGFEKFDVPDNSYDLVISNVPFGSYRLYERRYAGAGKSPFIHDFFFRKSMDKVRPGGLVAFITSTGTLDKADESVRRALYEQGDLVHAVRLPADAHKTAGTAVVTDIVILRKRLPDEKPGSDAWLSVGETPDTKGGSPIPINKWFLEHPELVLGDAERTGKLHGLDKNGEKRPNWTARDTYAADMARAIAASPEGVFSARQKIGAEAQVLPAPADLKPYALTVENGKVYQKQGEDLVLVDGRAKSAARVGWMRSLVGTLRKVWAAEMEGRDASAERKELNKVYDAGRKIHGSLNDPANARLFRVDPDSANLLALETLAPNQIEDGDEDEDSKLSWEKGPAFTKPTVRPPATIGKAENATQGVAASLGRTGRVDPATVAEAMGVSTELAEEAMRKEGSAYEDPIQGWQPRWVYLSGNVRAKLAEAEESASRDPERFGANVEALRKVQPAPKEAHQITPVLGAPWIAPETFQAFVNEKTPGLVVVPGPEGRWLVEGTPSDAANAAWGVKGTYRFASADEVLGAAMNGNQVSMSGRTQDGKSLPDKDAEKAATEKANELRAGFIEWMRQPGQSEHMAGVVKSYNEVVNVYNQEGTDHSWMTFDGMDPKTVPDDHQRRAAARAVLDGRGLLAHEVGTGKTISLVASAMESRRLGTSRKPVVATMNNLVAQFAREAASLYPGKTVLVQPPAWGDKGTATSRESFMARLATESFDLAIISHETLVSLPNDPRTEAERVKEVLEELEAAHKALADRAEGDRRKGKTNSRAVAALAKRIENAKQKLAKLNDHVLKVDNITFEQTGIDLLLVDEAHAFKNLPVITAMEGVLGLGGADAKRAEDLLLKSRVLHAKNGGERGLILATGTPISNTMVEVYAFQKMLQPQALKAAGLHHFDNWARSFGTTKQSNEVQADGTRKAVTRFAEWVNLSGLSAMLSDVMDVTLTTEIERVMASIPAVKEVPVKVELTETQRAYREWTKERLEKIKNNGKPEKGDDIALVAQGDALKSAIDMRLVSPDATEADGSKIPALAKGVGEIYRTGARVEPKQPPVQFIFQNVQTNPNPWGFSLNDAIVERLVAEGIPRNAIAVLDSNTSKANRNRIKAEAATGKYAVLIGSTEVLGTGTNAQRYALAAWHIDIPHRPADVIQRDGRVVRQGNLYRSKGVSVALHRVITEGTMDEAMWGRLALKKDFIYTALAGVKSWSDSENEMTEIETDGLNPEMLAAMASGDPDLVRSVELDEELGRLRRARAAHYNQRDYLLSQARSYESQAESWGRSASELDRLAKKVEGKIPEKPQTDEGTKGKDLTAKMHDLMDNAKDTRRRDFARPVMLGHFAGLPIEAHKVEFDGKSIVYTYAGREYVASDGSALLGVVRGRAEALSDQAAKAESESAKYRKWAKNAKEKAEGVGEWSKEAEYRSKREELAEIDTRLKAKPPLPKSLTDDMRAGFVRGLERRRQAKAAEEAAKAERASKTEKKKDRRLADEHASTDGDNTTSNYDRNQAFDLEAGDLAARLFNEGNVPVRVKPAGLPAQKGDPDKLGDILLDLGQALTKAGVGKTEFTTAGLRSEQRGVYKPATGQTVIRHNNLDVAAHEIAHRLDDFFHLSDEPAADSDETKRWKRATKQLKWFSYFGSTPEPGMSRADKNAYLRAEGWAEFIRAWVVNPEEATSIAPDAAAYLERQVPPAVLSALKEYSNRVRRFAGRSDAERTKANVRGVSDAAREAAKKEGVISQVRRAIVSMVEAITGGSDSKSTSGVPALPEDMGLKDKVVFGWFDSLYPALKRYRQALDMQGQKQSDLPLDKDYETLARLQAGFADRMDSMFVDGLVDQQNQPVHDVESGERMNLEWLIAPASQLAADDAQIQALLDDAMAQGVEERTVEEGRRNLKEAQREAERYRQALYDTDPDDPDIGKKYMIFLKQKVREARNKNERLTGIAGGLNSDYEQARRALKERKKGDAEFQAVRAEILRRYRAWADAVLDYAVQGEVIGADHAKRLKETHEHYIDLHRVMGEESAALPTKAFKGSSRLIDNPLVNLMHATWSTMEWADRNRVRRSFVDVLSAPRGLHQGDVKDLSTIGHEITEDEAKSFDQGGKRDDKGKVDGKKPYKVWKKYTDEDGKQKVRVEWWVFDPAIEAAWEAAHEFDNPGAIGELLHGIKKITQRTITAAPNFLIRQVFRDSVSRLVTSETGGTPFDLLSGYTADLEGRGVLERFKTAGGGQSGWDERGKEQYERRVMGELADLVKKPGHIVSTVRGLGRGYMKLASESDLANRRAEFVRAWRSEYKKQINAGESDERAQFLADLHAAKNARGLMDFAVAGRHARKINRYIVFFNAAMQALRRAQRALSSGHRGTTALRWGLYAALPTALLYAAQAALMDDDEREEWRQRPAEKRDFAWSWKLADNFWLDIPKPYEWGVLASAVERVMDWASGEKFTDAFAGYPSSLRTALLPVKEEYLAGTLRPFLEASTNYSYFTGRNIVSPFEAHADLDKRKGTASASTVGQILQEAIGVDARKIDHVISGVFGGFGRIATAKSSDPGWWAGAATGLTGRSPGWEAEDVQWVLDWGDRRKVGSRKAFTVLRDQLSAASKAQGAERDRLSQKARDYATKLRAAIEKEPLRWGGAAD